MNTMRTKKALMTNPRLIRLRNAPDFLGMDKNRFNADVRPYLTEIPIGVQGIAFDRLELDAYADYHKLVHGRPPERRAPWQDGVGQGSANAEIPGISRNLSTDSGSTSRRARQHIDERRPTTIAASKISVKS